MKYALLGDIHANYEALTAVVEKAEEIGVDRYICMGDIVGYNADPAECLEFVRRLDPEAVIRGNHDEYASTNNDLMGFNPQAAWAVEWTRENITDDHKAWLKKLPYQAVLNAKVTLVHATLDMPSKWGYIFDKWNAEASFNYQRTPVCFCGHTHVPVAFDKFGGIDTDHYRELVLAPGHKYLINVGSVGQPRDGNPDAALVIYSPEERKVELHRIPYDIAACQEKIRRAGLPERCAVRLAEGR
ncbi:MAG: metallophosphatase family protein [Candidatus Pacebacteria bacterium]|nr:metallophosphatase family protein [Candidatus Paceibacterota bacterium]